jgi:hypothetical protein
MGSAIAKPTARQAYRTHRTNKEMGLRGRMCRIGVLAHRPLRLPVFAQSQLLKGSVDVPEMLPQRTEPG